MCGIIGILRRPSTRLPPSATQIRQLLAAAHDAIGDGQHRLTIRLEATIEPLVELNAALYGPPGVRTLLSDTKLFDELDAGLGLLASAATDLEARLDEGDDEIESSEMVNALMIRLKDVLWAVRVDRLRAARAVAELVGSAPGAAAIDICTSIQEALSAIDRLEVRGRDSAGIQILVSGHGLDLGSAPSRARLDERADPLCRSRTVHLAAGNLSFVYKAAAEIGDLGDNTAALRRAIRSDTLLRQAIQADTAEALVLGHTRWASVGIISEPNAHPLDSVEAEGEDRPYVTAVLNGDVDNFADLKGEAGLEILPEITTDAKVIPTLTSRRLAAGEEMADAFRSTVASLEGSVAIGACASDDPDRLHLALRGSGQALYIGLAEDAFVVASEPYGLVEETSVYVRMDGETPANTENPTGSRGQIIELSRAGAGTTDGIVRSAYDGTPLPLRDDELMTAQITTRDIDRGDAPHFLLKEISEAPNSFRKTLRGKLHETSEGLEVRLPDGTIPPEIVESLAGGRIRSVLVIGQGTAHIAGMSLASALSDIVGPALTVTALPATELSGFDLADDMTDTLVVAISQSGTTTDTNRTVDLVRDRGAGVVAIVNRRNSDLTDKADGVLYTSDGRDVEMSVASTKAFYSQVAAGFLLSFAIAGHLSGDHDDQPALLAGLRDLPDAMAATLDLRPALAQAAQQFATSRRYWAVVGNGPNVVAAREIRIKLSELCYKSIACDVTEDKKHIDLSAEPMILVCAAGLVGSNADDVAKEVAIYRAHKAAPIVIASEGEERFSGAHFVAKVPNVHPRLAFILSAMVGHLFGYEAALAIDGQARPLREARGAIEAVVSDGESADEILVALAPDLELAATQFFDALRSGEYNGHLEASTAVNLGSLLRFALGQVPLDSYQVEHGKVGTPGVVLEDLTTALTRAIEELTRPIDAIKHQAKTVTVGISRSDETLLRVGLVREVLVAGAPRDRLSYESLRALADLDPVVDAVLGYTRYRVEGDAAGGQGTAVVIDSGGLARELPSRTARSPELRGTKNRVAAERRLLVAKGRSDGRPIMIVPEVKDKHTTGLTLLHVRFVDNPPMPAIRGALQGYRNRYSALRDAVTETEPTFREDRLTELPVLDLLAGSIYELADHWRAD
jgi:glucosamine--fructose-6-phosphate aminotransferase (isomerizing)